jgi:hypothetical protein
MKVSRREFVSKTPLALFMGAQVLTNEPNRDRKFEEEDYRGYDLVWHLKFPVGEDHGCAQIMYQEGDLLAVYDDAVSTTQVLHLADKTRKTMDVKHKQQFLTQLRHLYFSSFITPIFSLLKLHGSLFYHKRIRISNIIFRFPGFNPVHPLIL